MPDDKDVERALLEMIGPKTDPDRLLKAVKRRYPGLRNKDIVRAAFAALIDISERDVDRALLLQQFALRQRGTPEE